MENNNKNNNLNKVAYYPGCSLSSTAIDFNVSLKGLLDVLDIEHIEIDDWNCCGTTPAYNVNEELAATLSARNLLIAKEMGLEDILSPCVSCYNKLYKAAYYINSTSKLKNKREEKIRDSILKALKDMGFDTGQELNFKVYSIVEFLYLKKAEISRKFRELGQGNNENEEYSILNASLFYQKKDSKWEFILSGKNLTDNESINRDSQSGNYTRAVSYYVMPLRLMFTLKYNL